MCAVQHPVQAVWTGQLSVLNQAQLSFDATVIGGAGDWAQLLPDSQVLDGNRTIAPLRPSALCMCNCHFHGHRHFGAVGQGCVAML